MDNNCVTVTEASKIVGVTARQIMRYLASGVLAEDHRECRKIMIDVKQVFDLREQKRAKKRERKKV